MSAEEAGRTVQEILTGSLGVSRRMIQKLTRAAGIQLNGRSAYLARKVRAGDVVGARLVFSEEPMLEPLAMELTIPYEDDHLLVVDKPAGLLVHPVGRSGEPTLAHALTHHLLQAGIRTRVRPVHRLDRDTSGLVLVAKSAFAHQALDRQLREHTLRRIYQALTEGIPSPAEQTIEAPIGVHPRHRHLRAVVAQGGDRAVTHIRVRERYDHAALLEVELETGRTHQIRVHLAHIGHPLLGDVQYGARPGVLGRQALHASQLFFRHPISGELVEVKAELPAEFEALRRELQRAASGDPPHE